MNCIRRKVCCYSVVWDVAEPTKNKYLNFAIIAAETESSTILSEYPVAKKNPPHRIFWYYYTRLIQVDSHRVWRRSGTASLLKLRSSTAATTTTVETTTPAGR
jgi:hypothetical protein